MHGIDVLGREPDPASGSALGDQLAELLGGGGVVGRRAGALAQDLSIVAGDRQRTASPRRRLAHDPADGEPLPQDWRQSLSRQLGELAAAWQAPAAWEGMTTAGGVTLPAEVCGLVALDEVLLHGWDPAAATGQDYTPTDAEAEAVLPIVSPAGDDAADAAAREGMFGPPLAVPDGASPFERVLALSGRDPRRGPPVG